MKHIFLIILIGSSFLATLAHRSAQPADTEIPLIGQPSTHMNHQLNQYTHPEGLDESTKQLLIGASILATGYVLQYDINHALNDELKRQACMKGCIAYITGKQIQHFYKDNAIAQEAGTLLAHYGRTVLALLLIYG